MKLKVTRSGKAQDVGNPYYGRATITRSEEQAYMQLATNDYKKGKAPELFPMDDSEGVRVFPRSGLSGPRGS